MNGGDGGTLKGPIAVGESGQQPPKYDIEIETLRPSGSEPGGQSKHGSRIFFLRFIYYLFILSFLAASGLSSGTHALHGGARASL